MTGRRRMRRVAPRIEHVAMITTTVLTAGISDNRGLAVSLGRTALIGAYAAWSEHRLRRPATAMRLIDPYNVPGPMGITPPVRVSTSCMMA